MEINRKAAIVASLVALVVYQAEMCGTYESCCGFFAMGGTPGKAISTMLDSFRQRCFFVVVLSTLLSGRFRPQACLSL